MNKNYCIKRTVFRFVFFALVLSGQGFLLQGQHVPVHIDNSGIYDFIDELDNEGIIDVNTIAKPFSRLEIAGFLAEAEKSENLTRRQRREVDFYLRDFGRELPSEELTNKRFDLFYYSDSLFSLTVNPVLGAGVFLSDGAAGYYRYNGGEIHGSVGQHFGFYGSLRDNHESKVIGGRSFLIQKRGAVYKSDDEARDFSEARGGLTWSWNRGQIGLHKDHFTWGHGYNGANIFSGNVPSFAFISLKVNPVPWFELRYVHGWLVSEVVDSVRSFRYYDGTREVFADKYLAANFLTVRPVPRLYVSAGNSIVYADTRVNPAYLVPFLFYKSVDHTYNGASNEVGQNAQMFFDISSRQLKHFHLYSTIFVDEISVNRMFDKEQHSNYISAKAGVRISGVPSGMSFTAEYTRTNPMVYQHKIPTTTWESNGYNMGHYMRDNSDEWFFEVGYHPLRGVNLQLSYSHARKGKDYQSILINGEEAGHPEINQEEPRWGLPFMNEVRLKMDKISLKGTWQVINDGYVYFGIGYNNFEGVDTEKYIPPFYRDGGFSGSFGVNYGF